MTNRRHPFVVISAVATVLLSLLAAGCGGGGSPGIASVGSSTSATTTSDSSAGGGGKATGLLAYASCMRSHGVPGFPDPVSGGGISKEQVVSAFRAVSASQGDAAQNACRHLLPANGSLGGGQPSAPVTVADRADYLKAAACMRSHGFPSFPDPTFPPNSVNVDIPSSIDQNSSKFKSAATTCVKFIPAGPPYSHSNGS